MANTVLGRLRPSLLNLFFVLFIFSKAYGEEKIIPFLNQFGADWNTTRNLLKKEIEKNPENANLKTILANSILYENMLDFGTDKNATVVIDLLKKEIDKSPENVDLIYVLGNFYLYQAMFDKAKIEFKKILKINKAHSLSYLSLGNISFLRGESTKKAVEMFRVALKFDKKNERAYYLLNQIFFLERRFEEAIALLEDAKRNNLLGSNTFHYQAINYMMLNDNINATSNALKAVELEPSRGNLFVLAVTYAQKKDYKHVIEVCQNILKLDPTDKEALILMSQVLHEIGQREDAVRTISGAEKLYPDDEKIKEIRRKIAR